MTHPADMPRRDASREGSGGCLVCGKALLSRRARYCSRAHQQRAFRLRQQPGQPDLQRLRRELQRRRVLVAHTVYECPNCSERLVGERRCPDCHLFALICGQSTSKAEPGLALVGYLTY